MSKTIILTTILTSVILAAIGQISMKKGMNQYGEVNPTNPQRIIRMFTQPQVIIGLTLYAISTIFWLISLSQADLSYAYPMISIGITITTILSTITLKETLTTNKIIGTTLIIIGVTLIGLGTMKTT